MKTDKEELRKEGWEEHWEIVNNQIKEGVNPHAYRLGFLACSKQLEAKDKEIAELKSKISNILAVFHADGGHYESAHGTDKALADAVTKYYDLHAVIEDERMKVSVLSQMNFNLAKVDSHQQITDLKAEIERLKK